MKPNSTMCARFFQARLACVSMTPLGRPVVPDVYISRWTSSARRRRQPAGSRRRAGRRATPTRRAPEPSTLARTSGVLQALRGVVRQVDERLVAHEGGGLGVLEDVAHLGGGEPPVDRHRDGAEVVGGEDRLEELGAVVREQADDVAGADTPVRQAPGQRRDPFGHLAVGDGLALEDRERLVRGAGGVVGEHREPVHVGLHRRLGHHAHGPPVAFRHTPGFLYRPVSLCTVTRPSDGWT